MRIHPFGFLRQVVVIMMTMMRKIIHPSDTRVESKRICVVDDTFAFV